MTKTPEELTKDWKEGKLKSGLYWVNFKEKIVIAECTVFGDVSRPFEIEIKTDFMIKISKVLAPVPTYDEYKAMQDQIADASKKVEQLKSNNKWLANGQRNWWHRCQKYARENDNLRALLRECKPYLSYKINKDKHVGFTPNTTNLLTCINAALNETQANPADNIKIQESEE